MAEEVGKRSKSNKVEFERLKKILPRGERAIEPDREADLLRFEKEFQVELSPDHKTLLLHYGPGWIDDFIFLPAVKGGGHGAPLERILRDSHIYLDCSWKGFENLTPRGWPNPDCVMPFAVTSNGDGLFWDDTARDVIVIDSKSTSLERIGLPMIACLVEMLEGRLICECFPDDAFEPEHVFVGRFGARDEETK